MDNKKITLALAEDRDFQRTILRKLIENSYTFELAIMAEDGMDLIKQLGVSQMLPDACILDLHMPTLDGIETACQLTNEFPSIKLFGYTSTGNVDEIDRFNKSGVLAVYPKEDPYALLNAIEKNC